MTIEKRLNRLGIAIPHIMIPNSAIEMRTWSVIACDQFTSERSYWDETRRIVAGNPSTLNLIIPECYLMDGDWQKRVSAVNRTMIDILETNILRDLPPGFVLVERSMSHAFKRRGLVLSIDLEAYDFLEGSKSLIRPTEGTIRDRLPPRIAIRQNAAMDIPHILLLMDDPGNKVMKSALSAGNEILYDFDLMQDGGHITGRFVENSERLVDAFESLLSDNHLMFAVGDGNHSLAAAKEIWQANKARGFPPDHPSRYALAEVINIHDEGLQFHSIHRVLFNTEPDDFIREFREAMSRLAPTRHTGHSREFPVNLIHREGGHSFSMPSAENRLAVESLQEILDEYLSRHPEADIDYIHGEKYVKNMSNVKNRVGMLLPAVDKEFFFDRITKNGPFPRKTFSIGNAVEKRYYLESRRLYANNEEFNRYVRE